MMLSSRPYLRWVLINLLTFFISPLCFALSSIIIGLLLTAEELFLGVSSQSTLGSLTGFDRMIFLLAPLLTGLLMGVLVFWPQSLTLRKAEIRAQPYRWIIPGMLGLGLCSVAFAWTFSSPVFAYPLPTAALFSACLYVLTCALPQSRLLNAQTETYWRWLIPNLLAAMLAFPLAFTPIWLPEGPAYFWLIFPMAGAGGALYGLLSGFPLFSQRPQLATFLPGRIQKETKE
jgi:hypothetical protein